MHFDASAPAPPTAQKYTEPLRTIALQTSSERGPLPIIAPRPISKSFGEKLKYEVCKTKTLMINENSGYDIIYQKNKVENLKIASKTMNHILIYPNETFSFCYLVRNSKKYGKYKDGLILVDGKIVAKKGD